MDINKLDFVKLDKTGLNTLINWAENEGWNPGPHDANAFWQTDPDGFYGYYYKNKLIAGGSIVSYNDEFGFMGFFIVLPEFRSKGIGRKLWYQRRDMLLSRLKPGSSIGMDGVVDMQPFYNKGGFEIAFRDIRFEITGSRFDIDSNITAILPEDLENILNYDKKCFGFYRPVFIKAWLKMPEIIAYKYTVANELKGFIILRKAKKGYKVCPLFADDEIFADHLLKAGLNDVANENVYIDIPGINKKAIDLIKTYNGKYVFECARMYYGKAPDIEINKVFGITTFELG